MRIGIAISLIGLLAASAGAAAGPKPPALGERVELLKLPKDKVPGVTWAFPLVRISPKGDRCVYIRRTGAPYKTMLQIRTFGPPVAEHAVLAATPSSPRCWLMALSGQCWRADSLQVAYLVADPKEESKDVPAHRRLGVAVFDWSLPRPRQSGGGAAPGSRLTATAVTFGPAGKGLWRAESDLEKYASCRVIGPGGVAYKSAGFAIYHLAPSPDGRRLAWVEQSPTWRRKSAVVVMDLKSRKVVRRVELHRHGGGPLVWAAGGKTLCYPDLVRVDRIYRSEIRALGLADGKTRLIARDAKALGALGDRLLANRGPACMPAMQFASSSAPRPGLDPRPRRNEIILLDLTKDSEPVCLAPGTFAQQLIGRDLIYAEANGPDVIIWRAPILTEAE